MSVHIMVFDSGIGGTTVLEHIQQSIPHAQYSYFMDNALLPYGAQSQQTIINRLCALVHFIKQEDLDVDLIVIACNTASTSALSAVRQITDIPIVGVVPAIKPAAQLSQSKHIGLLATPTTVSSSYTAKLIQEHARHITVNLYSSVRLVSLAEQYFFTQQLDTGELYKELDSLEINKEVDVLVLGCTHFPILAKPINAYFNSKVQLLDSGAAIANRVSDLLSSYCGLNKKASDTKKPLQYYATADIFSTKLVVKLVTLIDQVQDV
ncbi:glutamate racemase [Pseudoalteromonas sp. SG45-5]|uniref:Glutamate racemase n=1 Tax=Pseudoalteromonas aliena TaxID=247523 RepID=A0A1Q2GY30_9GAMM|nr:MULTISPECIES: glutamate racemase [Pseudoalteromonas]AQP99920.1 glutamate racemase [Pseudoalteromonas aliena]MBB1387191.1 glutamate racemase [Pseudoalteromonas sp. SG45-5]MBB1395242.1 glutamate racemase [Pseudoalteromonas sp. SG44-4]MBB1448578.1 glutamate racemase [Pseudoalteromonas sp. SG41-6]